MRTWLGALLRREHICHTSWALRSVRTRSAIKMTGVQRVRSVSGVRYARSVTDFDELSPRGLGYLGPNTCSIARPSAASPSGVDVACALTYPTVSGDSPDSSTSSDTKPHEIRV